MPSSLRTLSALLALAALAHPAARAQSCTQTSTVNYRADAGTTTVDKKSATEKVLSTSFTASNYTTSTTPTLDYFSLTSDYNTIIDGRALKWRQENGNYTGLTNTAANNGSDNLNTPFQSLVTLTFNREVSGLTFVVQDIDKGTLNTGGTNNGGSDFTDELGFYALNAAGTRVALAAGNVTLGSNSTNAFAAGRTIAGQTTDVVYGTALNGPNGTTDRTGNVTITFASPVKSVRLSFRNLNTYYYAGGNPAGSTTRTQTVGFEQISWCAQADLTTTLTAQASPINAGATGQFNVTFANAGDLATAATTQTVQLPANLAGVSATVPAGISYAYNSGSGLLTYTIGNGAAATANPASYQGTFSSAISFTAPGTGPVSGRASISSSTTEGPATDLNPNNASANIAINAADLTTTLSGPGSLTSGVQSGNYTATYANNGPGVALSATRTVTVPYQYVSGVAAPNGTVTGGGTTDYLITFPAGSNVASGNSVSYTFTVTPTALTSNGQTIAVTSNTAPGTGGTSQGGNSAADQATVSYVVGAIADVGVSFSSGQADNSTVTAGTTVTYGVTFTNAGPSTASDVTRTVSIPAGVPSVTSNSAAGTVSGSKAAGWTITYPGGTVPLNATGDTYGFSYVAPASGPVTITARTSTSTNEGTNAAANSATRTLNVTTVPVSGTVYDDVNYGGGAGRTYSAANTSATNSGFASNAIGRAGATVEFYDGNGNYVGSTTTGTGGTYSYNLPSAGSYTVRVVNGTVTPARTQASNTTVVPVQTYVVGDANRVGGENPAYQDAPANNGSQTLASLSSGTVTPQSRYTATFGTTATTGVDFGFNFDTVVNTNDSGQGSLRQFIANANALSNTSLDQAAASTGGSNPAAGVETSIFMVTDGQAHAGLRAGLANQLNGSGVAEIIPASALPALTDAYTTIDGTTQTQNVGNTNNTTLGTGGTVGTQATALGQLNGPEVQLTGQSSIAYGLNVANSAANVTITGLAILDFGNTRDSDTAANVLNSASNFTLTRNVLGTTATAFAQPATITNADNVRLVAAGTSGSTISNNLIGFAGGKGIGIAPNVSGVLVTGNEVRGNGLGAANLDGIDIQGTQVTVSNNLFTGTSGQGIDSYRSNGGNTITGNTVSDNGRGTSSLAPTETPGIRVYGTGNSLQQNLIFDNYGAGIMLEAAQSGGNPAAVNNTLLSQNSIYNNGNVTARNGAAATGQIGIDLQSNGDAETTGTAPYVTKNNSNGTNGANNLLNYPIITSAVLKGNVLTVKGYAKAGAKIELFTAQANPASVNATGTYFGQGKTYLGTATEGSSADGDARTGLSYSGNINGFDQGSDNSANGFSFSLTLSSPPAAGSLLTSTATLTSGGNTNTSEFSGNARVQQAPIPNDATNSSSIARNSVTPTALNPSLSATAYGQSSDLTSTATNAIAYYTIASLPASGTLYYNGTALTAATIATTQITDPSKLSYQPVRSTMTSVSFTYTATDTNGQTSTQHNNGGTVSDGAATYTIPLSGPLPVQLVAFAAQASGPSALLKWTTASELNNDHFEVERSLDGTTFAKIGQVAGQGSKATATDYAYTDAGIGQRVSGAVYYRLKQVDTDGSSSYSPVQAVSFAGSTAALASLYPNPAATATGLDLSALPAANTYRVTLLDATGRQVRQLTLAGGQLQPLDLSELASGTYAVQVSGQQADGSALRQTLRLVRE